MRNHQIALSAKFVLEDAKDLSQDMQRDDVDNEYFF
jgi:hypothetical protein